MNRLDQIKDEMAREIGFDSWKDACSHQCIGTDNIVKPVVEAIGLINKISSKYANECITASLKKASEDYKLHFVEVDRYGDETIIDTWDSQGYIVDGLDKTLTVDKKSITNIDNIILL